MKARLLGKTLEARDFGRPLAALACCACIAAVQPALGSETFKIDSLHTIPAFEVQHFGVTTQRGRFDHASGWVSLDLAGRSGSVALLIDTSSIDLGSDTANRLIRSAAMLDVERFPSMVFESQHLIFDGDRVVGAEGSLTVAGVTRPISLSVSGFACRMHPLLRRSMCGGDISASLRRSDFGMTRFLPDIGDMIRIEVPVEAIAEPQDAVPSAEQTPFLRLLPAKAANPESGDRESLQIPPAAGSRVRSPGGGGSFSQF